MLEIEFIGKLALTGLTIFGIGIFTAIIHCILGLEDIIDFDSPKWSRYVANYSIVIGIAIMIVSLFLYIWS